MIALVKDIYLLILRFKTPESLLYVCSKYNPYINERYLSVFVKNKFDIRPAFIGPKDLPLQFCLNTIGEYREEPILKALK